MSSMFLVPDLAKLNLSPQARVKLSVLAFLFQEPAEAVILRAMSALVETLPPKDKDLVPMLESRIIPHDRASIQNTEPRLADQIRAFVRSEYIAPARKKHERRVVVRVKEVHKQLGLVQRYPAVVSALQAKVFLEDCKLRLIDSSGAKQGSTRVLVFELL